MTSGLFPFWISIDSRLTSEFMDVTDVSWLKPRQKKTTVNGCLNPIDWLELE
jgi:hypothetical protein